MNNIRKTSVGFLVFGMLASFTIFGGTKTATPASAFSSNPNSLSSAPNRAYSADDFIGETATSDEELGVSITQSTVTGTSQYLTVAFRSKTLAGYRTAKANYIIGIDDPNFTGDDANPAPEGYDKYNEDTAETMCRSLLESSIGDIVSAFQKFAACKYEEISGKPARVNDFQIVDKGSSLFEQETGKKYSDWLTTSELDFMIIMFQKRHLLEHNNGMVDQKYIDKSGDTSYKIGQRIIVKEKDAYTLLDIIRKLGNEIIMLNSGGGSSAH